jgi:pyrroline-5-carboxylate reductase
MPIGPGKYDDICEKIREETNAQGIVVAIIEGNKGTGFSCKVEKNLLRFMPSFLKQMAEGMEKDVDQILEERD